MEIIFAFIFGLAIGSFANVLIYRLPRGQEFVVGRSACSHCNTQLAWFDLIPVYSFIALGGRCRSCKAQISHQYILVELASGALCAFTIYLFENIPLGHAVIRFLIVELFLVLAIIDFKHLLLPDGIHVAIALLGIGTLLTQKAGFVFPLSWQANIITALVCGGFLFGIWYVSKGVWIGFGDVKLIALIGLLFGPIATVVIFYAAVLVGLFVGLYLLVTRQGTMKTPIPFGSLLALASIASLMIPSAVLFAVDLFLSLL